MASKLVGYLVSNLDELMADCLDALMVGMKVGMMAATMADLSVVHLAASLVDY